MQVVGRLASLKSAVSILIVMVLTATLAIAQASPSQPAPPAADSTAQPSQADQTTQPTTTAEPTAEDPNTVGPPANDEGGMFVFKQQVNEVVLQATVVDDSRRLVSNLGKNDFAVYEGGSQQPITSFHREDVPVAVGILIDNSGSMRDKREKVNQAVLNLIRTSTPKIRSLW